MFHVKQGKTEKADSGCYDIATHETKMGIYYYAGTFKI